MRTSIELPAESFRVYEIIELSDDVLPAMSKKQEAQFVSRIDFKKIVKFRMIGVLDLNKNTDEDPSVEEILSAPIAYLICVTDINFNTNKVKILYPGADSRQWNTTICINSDIPVSI